MTPFVALIPTIGEDRHSIPLLRFHVHRKVACTVPTASWWRNMTECCVPRVLRRWKHLTWVCSSRLKHMIPEIQTFGPGGSWTDGGGEDSSATGWKDICVSVDHHVITWSEHRYKNKILCFLHRYWDITIVYWGFFGPSSVPKVWSVLGPVVVLICPLLWSHLTVP